MPASPHNFHVGDQAEISYCYRTHTSTHTGTVVNSGPSLDFNERYTEVNNYTHTF